MESYSLPTGKPEARDRSFPHRSMASHDGPVEIVDASGKRNVEEDIAAKAQIFYPNGYSEFQEIEDMNSLPAFRRTPRIPEGSSYPNAGPSNYNRINSDSADKRKNIDGPIRVELLEQDRAELLRKLDELRDQLKRSCEVSEAPKGRFPNMSASSSTFAQYGRNSWFPDRSSASNLHPSQHSPFSNRFYPETHLQNGVHGFREASRASNNYIYHNDGFYHQPACACVHCYNGHWLPPAQVAAPVLSNPRVPPCPLGNQSFYVMEGSSMFGSQDYNHRVPRAPLHPHEPCNQHKFVFSKKESRPCRPFAGAAPFIICYNCSELLQIPEQVMQIGKHLHKLRCGSCSQLISFELDGTRLISSNNMSTLRPVSENNVGLSDGSKDVLQCHGNINRRQVISYSIDYDSPRYSDEKIAIPSFPVSSIEAAEKGHCSSSGTSNGLESGDSVICQRDVVPSSTELPVEGDAITRVPSLPLREHFGYSSGNQVGDDPGSGSMSKRSDQEKVASFKGSFKQNSVKDVPVATEMDFSAEDYPNAGFSQDSCDAGRDEDEPRISKGGDSFLGSLIKKSFKDFSRFNQSAESGRSKVSINGRLISDRMVKRAEKLAGPIHPGNYWYDYRAGFWGVMGHACLGIIPPFIEEFNYPIPKNCAAGNTGVLVNGRELNNKDLTLLASRGLPITQGQSYIIEISGKVWDEETGEELDCLGKLAPTIERMKRGFGMRALAASS